MNPVLNESNIGGHEYLRNLVHLPFFLQNAALRKVKHVKMMESNLKMKKVEEDLGPQIVVSDVHYCCSLLFTFTLSPVYELNDNSSV